MMSFIWFGRGTRTLNGFFFSAYMYTEVDIHTWLETEVTGSSLAWYHGKLATCSFFPALWTQYCSSAHSLHSACTRNKKPTWNLEPRWCKKKQKKKKLGQRSWVGPRRLRYGDRGGASSHGLTPVGSKPADKQMLSTLLFHLPTTHQPRLSYHRGKKKSSLRFAFVLINKPITLVKQYIWEEQGEIRHHYQDTIVTDHRVCSSVVPCQHCRGVFNLRAWGKPTSVSVACCVNR